MHNYFVSLSHGNRIVTNEQGTTLASFPDTDGGRSMFQIFTAGMHALAGASLYDEDRGQYIVGNLDQLLGG